MNELITILMLHLNELSPLITVKGREQTVEVCHIIALQKPFIVRTLTVGDVK